MRRFTIADPDDCTNPLSEDSGSKMLIYHGTSAFHANVIDKTGFVPDSIPSIIADPVHRIVRACDALEFKPFSYTTMKRFSTRTCVYFTASFRLARGYASNPGGEQYDGALRTARSFLEFAKDKQKVREAANHWERVLRQHGRPHAETEMVLANLRSPELVSKLIDNVEHALEELDAPARDAHPVIYAVLSDREWRGDFLLNPDPTNAEPCGGIEEQHVPVDRIVARIDYVNGIHASI